MYMYIVHVDQNSFVYRVCLLSDVLNIGLKFLMQPSYMYIYMSIFYNV